MEKLKELNLNNYKPLRDIVFENLREAIVHGRLEPGQRLMEIQLAEQLGVSRTPVREAIRKLELEGLVIMLPRKGAYVANVSIKDMTDLLEIRATLEGLAASLACERITTDDLKKLKKIAKSFKESLQSKDNIEEILKKDVEFHECIFKATHNEKLHQLINSLWEQVYRFRATYVADYDTSLRLIEEHELILNAIEKGDCDLAQKLAIEHIEKAQNFMMENIRLNK